MANPCYILFLVDQSSSHGCPLSLVNGLGRHEWADKVLGCWTYGGPSRSFGLHSKLTADFGWYAWEAYQVTHSLVWATIGFLFTWIFFEKRGVTQRLFTNNTLSARDAALWMWIPWFIHIVNDIPTHTAQFFPTPFLAPFSDIRIDGYRWSTPWVWLTNLAIIIAIWAYVFYKKRNRSIIQEGP